LADFPNIPIDITAEELLKTVQAGTQYFNYLSKTANWLGIKEGIYYCESFTLGSRTFLTKTEESKEYFYILVSTAKPNPTDFPYSRTITVIGACEEDDKNIHHYKYTRTDILNYTIEEINNFSNYYTKTEIDDLIGDIETLLGGI
jgi:hypothetical protein